NDELLDFGYVYTNLQNHVIQFVADDADYFSKQVARRKNALNFPVFSGSIMVNDRLTPGFLTSDFKRIFFEQAEKRYGICQIPEADLFNQEEQDKTKEQTSINRNQFAANFWEMNVARIEIVIPADIEIDPYEKQAILLIDFQMEHFVKNQGELSAMLDRFCFNAITSLNKSKSWKLLRQTLIEFAEYYAGMFEHEARVWMLYPPNLAKVVELINHSLENYDTWQKEQGNRFRRKEEVSWEVPKERYYSELYDEDDSVSNFALEPYFEYKLASTPEKTFKHVLERNANQLDWWYKNGDKGREHFSITYSNAAGIEQPFYVDFVIHFKSGKIGLFDTKTKRSDYEAPQKHNALIKYMEEENQKDSKTQYVGGIIIPEDTAGITQFRYCRNRIYDTKDLTGWDYFDPAMINRN
ncbi:MAG: hypothetical protein WKF91_16265, partial [Segetibacter sp.]